MSAATFAVTLTYKGDVVEATSLYYRDVQLMLKRLRKDGYSVRYICAGEHGEKKGRAHWHCILFFSGALVPDLPLESNYDWKYWTGGHIYAQNPDVEGFRYMMKYTLKDDSQRGFRKVLRLSKCPPIGWAFFQELAERMVRDGLAIYSPEYSFAHVRDRDNRPVKFWLTKRSLDMFLEHYVDRWEDVYGRSPPDTDFLWATYYDPVAKLERLAEDFGCGKAA